MPNFKEENNYKIINLILHPQLKYDKDYDVLMLDGTGNYYWNRLPVDVIECMLKNKFGKLSNLWAIEVDKWSETIIKTSVEVEIKWNIGIRIRYMGENYSTKQVSCSPDCPFYGEPTFISGGCKHPTIKGIDECYEKYHK